MISPEPSATERWFADCCVLDTNGRLTVDELLHSTDEWANERRARRSIFVPAMEFVLGRPGVGKDTAANVVAGVRLRRAGE